MRYLPYLALFMGSCLAAGGQLFLKFGATGAVKFEDFINIKLVTGLFGYFVGTVFWIWALSKIPLNIAYAFTALTVILVFVCSAYFLGERIMPITLSGLALILIGFVLIIIGGFHEFTTG